jgi:MFS family permease
LIECPDAALATLPANKLPRIFEKSVAEGVRSGKRRYLVALCLLLTATGLAIPFAQSLTAVVILVSIAASFGNVGPAANGALVGDLLRSPADAGRAFAFLVLGGNSFGLLAPIVTGYLVEATGSFNSAFGSGRRVGTGRGERDFN